MNFISVIENIPPALYGIIIGSFLTIIGVMLTNSSNTKQLRIQHEHERQLKDKERDLNLRRDVYLQVMEAIAAGLVAVGRVSEMDSSMEDLMRSYTDLSPKIGKVSIVGKNETIKAMANFQQELTGAFLRLSAKRESFRSLNQRAGSLENSINANKNEMKRLAEQLTSKPETNELEQDTAVASRNYEKLTNQTKKLEKEFEEIWEHLYPLQIQLVKESFSEVSKLDNLLVPLVGMMRSELELPFDQEYYTKIMSDGHQKQKEYLDAFFNDIDENVDK